MKKLIVAVFCIAASAADAADARGSYSVFGHGADHCGMVLDAFESGGADYANLSSWVNGYLTAVNAYAHDKKNISGKMDLTERMDWIREYCRKNPFKNLAKAVHALYKDLREK